MSGHSEHHVITIQSSNGAYPVRIGEGIARSIADETAVVVVADEYFRNYFAGEKSIFIEAAEDKKNLKAVEDVIIGLRTLGLQRDGHVYAVGGGIIQDVVTLSASLYMRGISWTYVPTTLMAMTDSCIGGKSSINAGRMKNLVGNIYPPKQVLIDTTFIASLDSVGIASGLAEAVKIAYCKGSAEFAEFLSCAGDVSKVDFVEMLRLVLESKKWFIEKDEFDKAERRLLNFGHTFGHALEVGTDYSIPHGLAVAVGVQAALEFVGASRPLAAEEQSLKDYSADLVSFAELPAIAFGRVDETALISAFKSDKKHSSTHYRLVLPTENAGVEIVEYPRNDVSIRAVVDALMAVVRRYQ